MHLLFVAVKSKLKIVDRKLPTNVNDLVNEFSCNIERAECMNNSCESSPNSYGNEDNFEEDVESSTDTDELDSLNSGNHSIKYYKWMTINGKASKVMVSLLFNDALETVKEKINELKYHLFVRNEQYKIYNNLKL